MMAITSSFTIWRVQAPQEQVCNLIFNSDNFKVAAAGHCHMAMASQLHVTIGKLKQLKPG
jgi:hypothetical protein